MKEQSKFHAMVNSAKKANSTMELLNDIQSIGSGSTGGERISKIAATLGKILGSS